MSERQVVFIWQDTHTEVKITLRHIDRARAKEQDKLLLSALEHARFELKKRMADREA